MTSREHTGGDHGGQYTEARSLEETFRPQFDFFERVFARWKPAAKKLLQLRLDHPSAALTPDRVMEFKKKLAQTGGVIERTPDFFDYLAQLLKAKMPDEPGVEDTIDLQDSYLVVAQKIGTKRMAAFKAFFERCIEYDENEKETGQLLLPGQRVRSHVGSLETSFRQKLSWFNSQEAVSLAAAAEIDELAKEEPLHIHPDFLTDAEIANFPYKRFQLYHVHQLQRLYARDAHASSYVIASLVFRGKSSEEVRDVLMRIIPHTQDSYEVKYVLREVKKVLAWLKRTYQWS